MINKIEYPMTENNAAHWGIWECVREILQNAMDEEGFTISYESGLLTICNQGSLSLASLLLGESEKSSGARGKYGEGMKLAMLVAARLDRSMIVYTGVSKWIPTLEHSDAFDRDLLYVTVTDYIADSIVVQLKITPDEWALIQSRYTTAECGILGTGGDIFVGGLWVCNLPKFEHSYNFRVGIIHLNRDRDIPNSMDVQWEATRLIENATVTGARILRMAERGSPEISSYSVSANVLTKAWSETHGDTVPVGLSEQGKVAVDGRAFRIVPDWLAEKIRGVRDFLVKKVTGSPVDRLEAWKKKYIVDGSTSAIELDAIINEMRHS